MPQASACPCRTGLGSRLFAAFQVWGSRHHEPYLLDHKRRLFSTLQGTVVEIGPGPGTNLPHLPRNIRWIGIEPNLHMHAWLRQRAAELGMSGVDLRPGVAEHIDLDDRTADAVIATLVLCSVSDLAQAIREIRRILKPGGRFIFIEHVGAPPGTRLRRVQRWVRPMWRIVGAGCEPDRDTLPAIQSAGFDRVEHESFDVPVPIIRPHIAGIAVA